MTNNDVLVMFHLALTIVLDILCLHLGISREVIRMAPDLQLEDRSQDCEIARVCGSTPEESNTGMSPPQRDQ